MPCSAALPTPTITDMGVASPSAQGQAMISTVVALISMWVIRGSGPKLNQAMAATTAISMMVGTKTAETSSARRPMGGLLPWAFFTSATMRDRAVSLPTAVAR